MKKFWDKYYKEIIMGLLILVGCLSLGFKIGGIVFGVIAAVYVYRIFRPVKDLEE